MLDTVTLGIGETGIPGAKGLQDQGWDFGTWRSARDGSFNAWATFQLSGVALKYFAGHDWISATCSLPKLLRGENASVLPWDQCRAALECVVSEARNATGVRLPPLDTWVFSRVDPVWAWGVEPGPYLTALRTATLPRCDAVDYLGSGLAWRSTGKRVRARVYDKRRETGHDVDLPLRVEAEVRPRKQVWRLGGVRVDGRVGAWDGATAAGIVEGVVHGLGLDRPIVSRLQARQVLIDTYGQRQGINTYRALLDALDCGGWHVLGQSPDTVRRHLRRLRQAGVSGVAPEHELPALRLLRSCPMSHVA